MSFGVGIGDIFSVIKLAKDVRRRLIDAPEQFLSISRDVKTLSSALEDVDDITSQRSVTEEQRRRLHGLARDCSDILEKLEATLDNYQELSGGDEIGIGARARRQWKKIKWDTKLIDEYQQRISIVIGAFNSFLSQMNLTISYSTKESVDATKEGVEDLRRLQLSRKRDEERKTILDWLTAGVDYASHHQSQHVAYFNELCEGTCNWLLTSPEFVSWLSESDRVLFCSGAPGAGKTVLTAAVINHLHTHTDGSHIAFIYCNYRWQQQQKPIDLLTAILQQFLSDQDTPDSLSSLYRLHKNKHTRPSLEELTRVLSSIIDGSKRAFILFDALDEIDTDRDIFVKDLLNIQEETKANVFVTSRTIPDIEEEFRANPNTTTMEVYAHDDDVRLYLDRSIRKLPKFVSRSLTLQKEIKEDVASSVNGMFLLAKLYMNSLAGKKVVSSVKSALKDFKTHRGSNAYDLAYKEAMERIKGLDADSARLAMQALSWVTCSERPLTALELRHTLAEPGADAAPEHVVFCEDDLPDIEDILTVCNGLITVEQHGADIVKFVHYTTQEYFERTKDEWFPDAQKDIAYTCIIYLSSDTFQGPCSTDEEFEERLRRNPFYSYAAMNWGNHVRASSTGGEEIVMNFLNTPQKLIGAAQSMFTSIALSKWNYREPGYSQGVMESTVTPLHIAAFLGLTNAVESMLSTGRWGDIHTRDEYGTQTPLSWAAGQGHVEVVKLLLAQPGADPETEDGLGQTPLYLATRSGHDAVVRILCEIEGVDPNRKNFENISPLYLAIKLGHRSVIETLLDLDNINLNTHNQEGFTPLIEAIHRNDEWTVKRLLKMPGIDIGFTDGVFRQTPLTWAASGNKSACVSLLLAADGVGRIINSQDREGNTALHMAVKRRGKPSMVQGLLAVPGVNVNIRNNYSKTPLLAAADAGDSRIVALLLDEKRIDLTMRDCDGRDALYWAACARREEIVCQVLAAGLKLDVRPQWEPASIALIEAMMKGHAGVVEQLYAGADPDPPPRSDGVTLVSEAVRDGSEDIVKLLKAYRV